MKTPLWMFPLLLGLAACSASGNGKASSLSRQDDGVTGGTVGPVETVLAEAPSWLGWTRFRHWRMLVSPQDGKPAILKLQGKEDSDTVWYAWPGKKSRRVWSANRYVGVLPVQDGSGVFIVERRYDAAHWLEITKISLFDEQGKLTSSFKPAARIQPLAALANNELLARTSDGRQSTLVIMDKNGKTVASPGPVVFKSCQSNLDGTRVLVEVGASDVRINPPPEPPLVPETTGLVMMNVREGKVLRQYPKAWRSQMSPGGNVVLQMEPGSLRIFTNGELAQTLPFARLQRFATFSNDDRWLGFVADDKYHLYDLQTSEETFALEEKEGFRFTSDMASVSNDGRSLVGVFRRGSPTEWKVLLLDPAGKQLWSKSAVASGGLSISADGKTAFICTEDRVLQVEFGP